MPIKCPARSATIIGLLSLVAWLTMACGSASLEVATPTPSSAPTGEASATTADTPPPVSPVQPTVGAADSPTPETESTPVSEPTPTPAATAVTVADASLTLRTAVVKLDSDGVPSVLASGEQMFSCENPPDNCEHLYGLYFIPDQEAHIYALQQDSTDQIYALFPNEEYSDQTNPVPAGAAIWVPKDINHWFYLDENIGQETIFVVASTEPIDELEALIGNADSGGSGGSSEATAQLISWLTDGSRGPGGVTESTTPVSLPDGEPPQDLNTIVLEASGDQEFVYGVEFQHVAPGVLR